MASKKLPHQVIWDGPTGASLSNVSFSAASREGVIRQVKQIARQVGLQHTICRVYQGQRLILHTAPDML